MESHSGEVVGREIIGGTVVVSVVVKVVEASDTGPGVIIWVFTVSTVVVASVTVVTVLILSAAVVVVGAVVVVVETGNMPAPDPSPIENFMTIF